MPRHERDLFSFKDLINDENQSDDSNSNIYDVINKPLPEK